MWANHTLHQSLIYLILWTSYVWHLPSLLSIYNSLSTKPIISTFKLFKLTLPSYCNIPILPFILEFWILSFIQHILTMHWLLVYSATHWAGGRDMRHEDIRDMGSIPGLGRSRGGGQGKPLQYSCLENPTDRAAKSLTQLKWLSTQLFKILPLSSENILDEVLTFHEDFNKLFTFSHSQRIKSSLYF